MQDQVFAQSVALAPAADRSAFLRQVAARTLGGLFLTAVVSVFSTLFIAPVVFRVPASLVGTDPQICGSDINPPTASSRHRSGSPRPSRSRTGPSRGTR